MPNMQTKDNYADKNFEPIKALRDGADFFWNYISSLETGIVNTVNALFCNNVSDEQQTTKPKTSNLENSICNFIAQISCINTKVEGVANTIAQWKRNSLEKMADQNLSEDKIETLAQETRQKAIDLYRKISGGSETQQEINLITLLHEHRLKLIKEVLNEVGKSESKKLKDIEEILENKGDFKQHINLANNIYCLTEANFPEANFQPDASEPSQSSNNKLTSFNSDANLPTHRGNYPQYTTPIPEDLDRSQSFYDQKTKEELLFRLNDFKYSCLGVLNSGVKKSHQIQALKELFKEHSSQTSREDFVKKHEDLKRAIEGKIETGAKRLEDGLKSKNESIKQDVANILNQTYRPSKEGELNKAKFILFSKAEDITESMFKLDFKEIKESFSDFSYAVKQMMYFYTFQEISYARGKELAEKFQKIVQPFNEPPIPAPRLLPSDINKESSATSCIGKEGRETYIRI